jgi:hypothetical protein
MLMAKLDIIEIKQITSTVRYFIRASLAETYSAELRFMRIWKEEAYSRHCPCSKWLKE